MLVSRAKFGIIAEYLVMLIYLIRGYKFLYHRWKIHKLGEIDLIFSKKNILIFVEVKARSSQDFLLITKRQETSLLKTIKLFLYKNPIYQNYQVRVDFAYVNKFFCSKICKNVFLEG